MRHQRRSPGFRVAVVAAHYIGEAFCEAVEPLLALGHRVHFRIPLLGLVLGGAGGIDDRGIKDCSYPWPPADFVYSITPLSLSI